MILKLSRTRIILIAFGLGAAIGGAFFLHQAAPPECARLLPESDAIVYFNLSPLRAATHFDRRPVPHDPAYQHFIDATGIDFERDLDEAAFALSRQPNPLGPNGPVAYSEVFSGHFDRDRLTRWLVATAAMRESYAGRTLYTIPSEGRSVRIAVLSGDLVAVSNTPTPEQIHSILDHYRSAGSPWLSFSTSGPTLLTEHYKDLPVLSLAWGLGQIGLPLADSVSSAAGKPLWQQSPLQLLGFTLPFRLDTTFVASIRWTGALRLRIEEIAPSATAATASAASLQSLVNMAKLAENNLPAAMVDTNTRALVNSIAIAHMNDRAVLDATLPPDFFKKMVSAQDAVAPKR